MLVAVLVNQARSLNFVDVKALTFLNPIILHNVEYDTYGRAEIQNSYWNVQVAIAPIRTVNN